MPGQHGGWFPAEAPLLPLAKLLPIRPEGSRPLLKHQLQPAGSLRSDATPFLRRHRSSRFVRDRWHRRHLVTCRSPVNPEPKPDAHKPLLVAASALKTELLFVTSPSPFSSHNNRRAVEGKTPDSTSRFPSHLTGASPPLQRLRGGGLWIRYQKTISLGPPPGWEDGGARGRWTCTVKAQPAATGGRGKDQGKPQPIKERDKPPSSPARSPRARGSPPA